MLNCIQNQKSCDDVKNFILRAIHLVNTEDETLQVSICQKKGDIFTKWGERSSSHFVDFTKMEHQLCWRVTDSVVKGKKITVSVPWKGLTDAQFQSIYEFSVECMQVIFDLNPNWHIIPDPISTKYDCVSDEWIEFEKKHPNIIPKYEMVGARITYTWEITRF